MHCVDFDRDSTRPLATFVCGALLNRIWELSIVFEHNAIKMIGITMDMEAALKSEARLTYFRLLGSEIGALNSSGQDYLTSLS